MSERFLEKLILSLLALAFLLGCGASSSRIYSHNMWHKEGADTLQQMKDGWECSMGLRIFEEFGGRKRYIWCMEERGYVWTEEKQKK
jgi:hypothetical protein